MTTQTTPAKIILPNNAGKSTVIMTPTDWNVPEGYELIQQPSGQHVLRDSLGRINITHIFNQALATDPTLSGRSPAHWLRQLGTKELRSNYQDLFGFDPVNTVKGGDKGKGENQRIKPDESLFDNYQNINVSTNGNIQTYGTYMSHGMTYHYLMWCDLSKCILSNAEEISKIIKEMSTFSKLRSKTPDKLYLIYANGTDVYKIGISSDPIRRLNSLMQSSPYVLSMVFSLSLEDPYKVEQEVLKRFAVSSLRGEWFRATGEQVSELLEELIHLL